MPHKKQMNITVEELERLLTKEDLNGAIDTLQEVIRVLKELPEGTSLRDALANLQQQIDTINTDIESIIRAAVGELFDQEIDERVKQSLDDNVLIREQLPSEEEIEAWYQNREDNDDEDGNDTPTDPSDDPSVPGGSPAGPSDPSDPATIPGGSPSGE